MQTSRWPVILFIITNSCKFFKIMIFKLYWDIFFYFRPATSLANPTNQQKVCFFYSVQDQDSNIFFRWACTPWHIWMESLGSNFIIICRSGSRSKLWKKNSNPEFIAGEKSWVGQKIINRETKHCFIMSSQKPCWNQNIWMSFIPPLHYQYYLV